MAIKYLAEQHSLDTVKGNAVARDYLIRALEANILPHALLLCGPQGVGKLSTAYALVKRMNCKNDSPAGCTCNICRKISEGKFADVLLVEPKGATGSITLNGWRPGKDDPDNLQYWRFIDSRPMEGSRKVVILRHAERMNVPLANFILKLMEEPPSYLNLILISSRKSELLPTIRSRCAQVKFSPLDISEMKEFAEGLGANADSAAVMAAIKQSGGLPGNLDLKVVNEVDGDSHELATAMLSFRQLGFVSLFRVASDLLEIGTTSAKDASQQFEATLNMVTAWFKDAIILKTAGESSAKLLNYPLQVKEINTFGDGLSIESLLLAADAVGEYRTFARRQTDKNYALECLLMEIGRIIRR